MKTLYYWLLCGLVIFAMVSIYHNIRNRSPKEMVTELTLLSYETGCLDAVMILHNKHQMPITKKMSNEVVEACLQHAKEMLK